MKKKLIGAAVAAIALPGAAAAECGEVSITQMNWASSEIVTAVSKFLMEQGYGCEVTVVPSDTVPAVTSLAENGEPDIVTELWLNGVGDVYRELRDAGRVIELGRVLNPGGIEGWWIPTYLAEAHPELTTIEGVLANPELVGGQFNNCPVGWGCRVANDNLIRALDLRDSGMEVFDHGSGETLATSMASAVQSEEPWFGYYWAPTVPLGKFDMTRVELGEYNQEAHEANQNPDNPNPQVTGYPAAEVITAIVADFQEREPEIAELMSKVTFDTDTMSGLLAWADENGASNEEAAVYFLQSNPDVWSGWLNDAARENLSALLK
ncbi:ABC transporter substrate-binding protein [Limimaricola pyoseonensis]|uniref:Glycine betaine/proline transport system substrate-binding protein n=1 Tax=Limimaricola pyoseonensis TaxID=521013 RepID=A0A1G7FUE1_9RHOB|nr:ABC transporter substrate-binding protein [Limimaricola pyoseonensis]SDE79471.1 glycine betaine/proline transport system substrate-binding protein [Limimaricola pyoseonensis]